MRSVLIALAVVVSLWCGAAHAACGSDPAPAVATAYGLTCETFVDTMSDPTEFDTTDTRNSSYRWFVHNAWPTAVQNNCPGQPKCWYNLTPTASEDYTVTVGGLVMSPITNVYPGLMFSTCAYTTSPAGYVGTTFEGSFYIDVTFTYVGTPSDQYSTVWMQPTEFLTAGADATQRVVELDLYESHEGYDRHVYDWIYTGGLATTNYNYVAPLGGSTNGTLVVAPELNGGVGLLERATDDVVFDTLQYSPTMTPVGEAGPIGDPVGTFSPINSQHYCILMTSGTGQTTTISKIAVWQQPPGKASGARRQLFR